MFTSHIRLKAAADMTDVLSGFLFIIEERWRRCRVCLWAVIWLSCVWQFASDMLSFYCQVVESSDSDVWETNKSFVKTKSRSLVVAPVSFLNSSSSKEWLLRKVNVYEDRSLTLRVGEFKSSSGKCPLNLEGMRLEASVTYALKPYHCTSTCDQ